MTIIRLREWLLKGLFLLVPIAYVPWADEPYRAFREELFQLAGAGVLLLWLYGRITHEEGVSLSPRGIKADLILYACGTGALLLSLALNGGHSPAAVINVALGGILFLAFYNAITPETAFEWTKLFIFAAVLNGLLGIAQYAGYDPFFQSLDPAFHNVYRRYLVAGFMDSPNMLAPFLASFVPLAYAFFMHETARGKTIAWTLRSIFLLTVIAFTQNLGALLALGVVLGAMLLYFTLRRPLDGHKRATPKLVASWVMALMVIAMAATAYARQDDTTRLLKRHSIDERWMQNKACLMMFQSEPIIGKGPGFFYAHFEEYRRSVWFEAPPLRLPDRPAHQAHNDYLQLLAEGGLLAALPFGLLLILWMYRHTAALLRRELPPLGYPRAPLLPGAIGGFWVIALNGLGNFPFHIAPLTVTALFWAAVAAVLMYDGSDINSA